jgi:thiol-disulfide isomerase/thioredoxin
MKKLFLFTITLLTILGCQNNNENKSEFRINLTIQDTTNIDKVILLTQTNEISDTLDLKSNKLTFKGTVSEPVNAGFLINKTIIQFPLVNDKIDMVITDIKKKKFTIQYLNSKINENLESYFNADYLENYKALDAIVATSKNDQEIQLNKYREDSLAVSFLDSLIVKFKTVDPFNGLSIIVSDLSGLIGTRNHPEKIEELFYLLPDTLKNGYYGKKVKKYLDGSSKIAIGQQVNFSFIDIYGNKLSISDFKNKFVLIEFWATWCGPCIALIPEFKKISSNSNKIQIISVSIDDDIIKWKNKVTELRLDWINAHYLQPDINLKDKFFITGVPNNILLSQDGTILQKNIDISEIMILLK